MDRPFAPWEKASVIYSSLDSLLWAHHVATVISKKRKGVIVGEDFLGVQLYVAAREYSRCAVAV